MASERDILEYVNYAEEDERLESRVQVQRGVDTPILLQASARRGVRRGQLDALACDADTLLALIDRGDLAFREGWLTITPAGQATLAQGDEPEAAPAG